MPDNKSRVNGRRMAMGVLILSALLLVFRLGDDDKQPQAKPTRVSEATHAAIEAEQVRSKKAPVPSRKYPEPPISGSQSDPASVRFRAARLCAFALMAQGNMQRFMKICEDNKNQPRNAENKAYVEFCRVRSLEFSRSLPIAENDLKSCATQDQQEANEKFYEDTVRAARAGDPDAQICYLRAQFWLDRPWTDEETRLYVDSGPGYMQQALERGDWRIAEMLSKATPGRSGRLVPMLHNAVAFEAVNPYRMNRLLRRGAVGRDYARFLDGLAPHHAADLSAQQIAESDRWAADTYDLYFTKSQRLEKAPSTCMGDMIGYDPSSY